MAICALHNYLMSSLPDYYAPPENLEDGSTITDFTIDSTFPDFTTDNIIDSTYQDLDHIESRQARSALSLAKKSGINSWIILIMKEKFHGKII